MSRNIVSLTTSLIFLLGTLSYSLGVSALSSLGTDFVGTTTNSDFLFYANSTERLRITTTGYVRISTGYLDYLPGGTACANGQILSYNTVSTRWQCASDSQGVSGTGANNSLTKWTLSGSVVVLTGSTALFESGNYLDYRPGGVACTNSQLLSYNLVSARWECSSFSQGVTGTGANNAMAKWVGNGTGATLSASTDVFESGGNIGVGTSNPLVQLHVLGGMYLTGGNIGVRSLNPVYGIEVLGSGSGGMVATQSGFCINGTCITTWQGLNNLVTSTGNPNYIAKFGSTGALSNSQLYETGSKLYIGDVPAILAGTATSSYGYITIETFGSTNSSNPLMTLSENGGQECRLWIGGANKLGSNCEWVGGVSGMSYSGNTIIRADALGTTLTGSQLYDNGTSVGVGLSDPDLKLVVYESGSTNRAMQVKRGTQASDASMITAYGTPYLTIGGLENRVNSLQTIGFGYNSFGGTIRYTPAEIGFLTTSVAGNTLGDIVFATRSVTTNTAASEVVRITSTGAVGIGTIAPKAKLEVSGGDAIIYGVSVGRGSGAITTNTAIGSGALRSNTTGNFNTANGLYALRSNTTGAANTANGVNALLSNTTGISNTANGVSALFSNTTGNYNTANGQAALISNTTGNYNTANGMNALQANTTGGYSTAYGFNALSSNTTGVNNTADGYQALFYNTIGGQNTANGVQALYGNAFGSSNVANGYQALYSTTGDQNTANGYQAGSNITTGSNNTTLGNNAQVPSATGDDQVRIGDTAVTYAGIQVAWTVTSDRRWKDDIHDVGLGLDFIRALRPVDYFRKNDASQKREAGFIAQEVESTLAQFGYQNSGMLNKDDNGYYSLRYNDFFAPIVRAIQELSTTVRSHDREIEHLTSENQALRARLDAIEARFGK